MMTIRMMIFFIVPVVAAGLVAGFARGALASSEIYSDDGVAVEGADVVAYFTGNRPVDGDDAHEFVWRDAVWRFANEENRALFASDPEKYAPQYGGYCAYAVSRGYTASIDPGAWTIVDDKLYLNYSKGVRRTWERDIPGNVVLADKNWPGLRADLLVE